MKAEETELVDSVGQLKGRGRSASLGCKPPELKRGKPTLSQLLELIKESAKKNNEDHQVLIKCLSFLANADHGEEHITVIPEEYMLKLPNAISNILASSDRFSRRLKWEWRPLLPDVIQEQIPETNTERGRPRSLTAVSSSDSLLRKFKKSKDKQRLLKSVSHEPGSSQDSQQPHSSHPTPTAQKTKIIFFGLGTDIKTDKDDSTDPPDQNAFII